MANKKVIDFIKKHKEFYPEYFEKDRLNKVKYDYTCDINQIYCYLKLKDIKKTNYYTIFSIISRYFDLNNKNILQTACGYIPILSGLLKEQYKCNITAVNNKIIIHNYKGVETLEYDLNKSFDLTNYDLIIGFRSCIITEKIIVECFEKKKDFVIYLCPCDNPPLNKKNYDENTWTYKKWHNYLINLVLKNEQYKSDILYNHGLDDCPIIIAKCTK